MSSAAFYILLAVGAAALAPFARLIPTGRDAMILPMAILVAVVFSMVAGTVVSAELDGHNVGSLLASLALAPLCIVFFNCFGSDHGPSGWSDAGGWDSGCGDSGDGGSCD